MSDPHEALRPILQTGHLARYRLLDVVCQADQRLIQVIGTPQGPVVLYRPGGMQRIDAGAEGPEFASVLAGQVDGRRRRDNIARWLGAGDWVEAYCRHGGETNISEGWVAEQIAAGRRRVVWEVRQHKG